MKSWIHLKVAMRINGKRRNPPPIGEVSKIRIKDEVK